MKTFILSLVLLASTMAEDNKTNLTGTVFSFSESFATNSLTTFRSYEKHPMIKLYPENESITIESPNSNFKPVKISSTLVTNTWSSAEVILAYERYKLSKVNIERVWYVTFRTDKETTVATLSKEFVKTDFKLYLQRVSNLRSITNWIEIK